MQCDTNRCIPKSWICDGLKGESKTFLYSLIVTAEAMILLWQ